MAAGLAVLAVLGILTHLPTLTQPREVVFDEVTFGKFVSAYCGTGERMFDVHPPHGKLLISAGAWLGGYRGGFSFERIGLPYGDAPVFALRLVPALAGIAIPLLLFLLLRGLGASTPAGFAGGLLIALDNAMILETRIIVFDGILVASILGALVAIVAAARAASPQRAQALSAMAGALAGLAVGVKLTGLVAPFLVALYGGRQWLRARGAWPRRQWRRQLLAASAAAAIVYVGGWAIHFALLTKPGPADLFHPTTGRFVEDFRVAHATMWRANLRVATASTDASRAWTWPLMKVAPYFWVSPTASIYLIGNPVVWWGGTLLFAGMLMSRLRRKRGGRLFRKTPSARPFQAWLPLLGYLVAYLPLWPVTRVLFVYHYLTALVFSIACVALWADEAGLFAARHRRWHAVALVVAVLGFLTVAPLTYGVSVGGYDEWLARLIRSWR